ncbi:MAG: hypothetical protein QUS14_13670 [Pyrinomonadaceae bacterium]|nr:hypothetical protein [Pyrinomonadaceae bacterium]
MIVSLFNSGLKQIETISEMTEAKPSYVASVLQGEGLIDSYFDLYTSTQKSMNVYSKHFKGRLGFKDVETAMRSVGVLEAAYRRYDMKQDRAGQHHTLEMALTMLDRARWTGKLAEAEVYRRWLVKKISTPLVDNSRPMAVSEIPTVDSEQSIDLAA